MPDIFRRCHYYAFVRFSLRCRHDRVFRFFTMSLRLFHVEVD